MWSAGAGGDAGNWIYWSARSGMIVGSLKGEEGTRVVGAFGACGLFWDVDSYDWDQSETSRLIGRRGLNRGSIRMVDFSRASGIYVLYNEVGVYYVGLARGSGGLRERIRAHTFDQHRDNWSRFSWFSLNGPDHNDVRDDDGMNVLSDWTEFEKLDFVELIRDSEAMLIAALKPPGNVQEMRFLDAEEWFQVPIAPTEWWTFDELKQRIDS